MATSRVVNTNFWKDTYVIDLDPTEKLLFLYFLTNPRTTLAGVYEISLREVAFDTGIDKDMVQKILDRFCRDEKMYFEKNWLVLRNFIKHQRLNPSIKRGIEKAIDELPDWLQEKLHKVEEDDQLSLELSVEDQTGDRLGTDTPQYNLIKSNIKKKNADALAASQPAGKSIIQKSKVPSEDINEMFDYWKEALGYDIASNRQKNRYACSNLLKKYGTEKLKQIIDGVVLASEDRFAPRISDFCDVQAKLNGLLAWGRKRNVTTGIEVIS